MSIVIALASGYILGILHIYLLIRKTWNKLEEAQRQYYGVKKCSTT